MKKQINSTIKAHLIRGAFYLLLLIAVSAIPFTLAQRNTTKRSLARPKTATESLAAKGRHGVQFSTAGRHVARPYDGPTFPRSSVRTQGFATKATAPNLPRTSREPQSSSGPLAAHLLVPPQRPKAPQVTNTITTDLTLLCRQRSRISQTSAPIWLTTLSCPVVRLGTCSQSMLTACISMVLDLPLTGTFSFTRTMPDSLALKFTDRQTKRSNKTARRSQ